MRNAIVNASLWFVTAAAPSGCGRDDTAVHAAPPPSRTITVVPRTPAIPTYPCTTLCHVRQPPNPTPRPLRAFHTDKQLAHGTTLTWCLACHDDQNLDRLHLIDGSSVSFDESYRVCAQCHEERYRDWTRGIHGLTTGSWRDVGIRRNCPTCHNPHDPHRTPFDSLPPPARERAGAMEMHHE
jgi:hypothetical protein